MRAPLSLNALLAAAATAALAGCGYRSQMVEPILLSAEGPIAVNVVSFNGDVTVTADPNLPWATIRMKRQATHGFRRHAEAKESLANIQYSARIVPGERGPVLEVRTWTTDKEPWFQRAHVDIQVPTVDGLTIRTSNGTVEAWNIRGTVDITSSGGDVQVMTTLLMVQPVTINNTNGDIDYRVRIGSTARFDCHAENGSVDGRIRHGRFIIHNGTNDHTLLATLNGGTNPVRLTTVNGDIRIAVVKAPTDVGSWRVTP